MGKYKLKLTAIALVAIVMTFFAQETLAYYTTVGTATNVITSGNIQFTIHETTKGGNPFPEEGVYVTPGQIVSKEVRVENSCAHPFYLRVKAVYGIDSKTLSAEDCFKLDIDPADWTLADGWYYYNRIVEPGETTPVFFSLVEMVGAKMDNAYLGKTLTLTVKAQAVQSQNNPVTDDDMTTAVGWPQEE